MRNISGDAPKQTMSGAVNRLAASGGNIAVCEHCRNAMDFVGDRFCKPCRSMLTDSNRIAFERADALFRRENRRQFKVFALIVFFGALFIALLSYLAHRQF